MKAIVLFATMLAIAAMPAAAATTGSPSPKPSGPILVIHPPGVALHNEYLVEVNKLGQVVRIKSGTRSKSPSFNLQTQGNALQMWIRKPDGTATVGLFKVMYDYDPKTHKVERNIALVSLGGNWGDEEGAANRMMDLAKKEALDAQKKRQQQNGALPSLNEITGHSPSPSPSPHL